MRPFSHGQILQVNRKGVGSFVRLVIGFLDVIKRSNMFSLSLTFSIAHCDPGSI